MERPDKNAEQHLEPEIIVENTTDNPGHDESVEFDGDKLKEELGIDRILKRLDSLEEKMFGGAAEQSVTGAQNTLATSDGQTFDPSSQNLRKTRSTVLK